MRYSTLPNSNVSSNFPRSTSPLPAPANYQPTTASAAMKRYKYFRRIFKFNQMDFEFAAWQMVYLFIAPQKVFRNFNYRKHTKYQFARDDPAFLVLLSFWFLLSSVCLGIGLKFNTVQILVLMLFVVFVDFIGVGLVVSTFFWYLSNRYLRRDSAAGDVEWAYAFDVHINAFFPPLLLLHFFQTVLFGSIEHDGNMFLCMLVNVFWLASIIYYLYITFLGYSNLPILHNTRVFLLPLPALFLAYFATIALRLNLSEVMQSYYNNIIIYTV